MTTNVQLLKLSTGEEIIGNVTISPESQWYVYMPLLVKKMYSDEDGESMYEGHLENWFAIGDHETPVKLDASSIIATTIPNQHFEKYYLWILQTLETKMHEEQLQEEDDDESLQSESTEVANTPVVH